MVSILDQRPTNQWDKEEKNLQTIELYPDDVGEKGNLFSYVNSVVQNSFAHEKYSGVYAKKMVIRMRYFSYL